MPIQNKISIIPIDSIIVPREARQRTRVEPVSIRKLAYSIGQSQWISPILVDLSSKVLIAGERRLTAVKLLRKVKLSPEIFSEEDLAFFAPVADCTIESWKNWTHIPVQFCSNLTEVELLIYEFIENKEREDLPWFDKAKAIYDIHATCIKQSAEKWTAKDTSALLGVDHSDTTKYLKIQRVMLSDDERAKQAIVEAPTLYSASSVLCRIEERREDRPRINLELRKTAPTLSRPLDGDEDEDEDEDRDEDEPLPPKKEDEDTKLQPLGSSAIVNADFHIWAAQYNAKPFNFIHCDFPYGIGYNKGKSFNTAADTKLLGEYEDNEQVYWALLKSLARYQDRLIAPTCHIMFWFSQGFPKGATHYTENMRRKTEDFFLDFFPRARIQPFPMIWTHRPGHTVPDHNRYGLRDYETAFLLTFGDRKIVRPVHLTCIHNPVYKVHRSQKPTPVLEHFFTMLVDGSTRMLDPTCGSGSSLIAAHRKGADQIVGIEIDKERAADAIRHFDQSTAQVA